MINVGSVMTVSRHRFVAAWSQCGRVVYRFAISESRRRAPSPRRAIRARAGDAEEIETPVSEHDLEAEYLALLAEHRTLSQEHERLHARPWDIAAHEAHRLKLRAHNERLHAHLNRLRARKA
jgi:hypothetical protein